MSGSVRLEDGSRIAIIGGGPAGAFFAHFAQKFAEKRRIEISTTIFDGKDFLQRGPRGCNLCAGVIAESLNENLKQEGIFLPEKRIINRVDGYSLHLGDDTLHLSHKDFGKNSIATVFRGNGPRYSIFPDIISFDDFLLSWAQDQGAHVIPYPVWDIKLPKNKDESVFITYGKQGSLKKYEADLVVGAFGVNTSLMKKMEMVGFGYRPPPTLLTYQAELKMEPEIIQKHSGNTIHVFMLKTRNIRYATIIPKDNFLTVTIIGKKNLTKDIFPEFMGMKAIQEVVPPNRPSCFCYPRIVVSPSKKPFSDRLVIIGDAGFSRHYKNGLESAFLTAKLASETAFFEGIDANSFFTHYYKRAKKLIVRDNFYGRFLFALNDVISYVPLLTQIHFSLAQNRNGKASSKKIRSILWYMFTGNIPYKDIFKISLDLELQISLLSHTILFLVQRLKTLLKRARFRSTDADSTRSIKRR